MLWQTMLIKKIIKRLRLPLVILFCLPILFISFFFSNLASSAVEVSGIEFIGETILPTGLVFQNTELGGLSGITYDAKRNLFYSISDDRSQKAPARFYTFKIDLSKGKLSKGSVVPSIVTTLLNDKGQTFSPASIDSEGIALTSRDTVFISSEGDAASLINPFVKEFELSTGKEIQTLPIPTKFLPTKDNNLGIRNNLAFESLTITPDESKLFTATENALIQDGTEAQPKVSSPSRILQYNLLTGQPEKEFLYLTDPVKPLFNLNNRFSSGLPDLFALDNEGNFLSIERTFTGLGFYIALYQVSLEGATDISNINSLLSADMKTIKPVKKKLLFDLRRLDVALDNIEGLTLGPKLPDGQQALILVSDNNFQKLQRTQFLAFKVKIESPLRRILRRLLPNFNR
jgi:hypothetical protein